ncbi:alpha/beta-hydrolase [Stipitochalara longipes BDJ]|nr:alpha/beta-hydrolase [Stipitochalara longipes BDJ]
MAWAPTLPLPVIIDGLNHIPPTLKGHSLPSSCGVTRFYDFSPNAEEPVRRVLLIHGVGTSCIGMAPLALRLKATAHVPAIFHIQILELLSYLKWGMAHILGFSGGGSISATFVRAMMTESWWGLFWLRRWSVLGFVIDYENKPKPDWKERLRKGEVDPVAVQLWERVHHKGHEMSVISMFEGLISDHDDKFAMLPKSGVEVLLILGEKDTGVRPEDIRKALSSVGWSGDIHEIEGAGHDVVRPCVDETARVMNQFWTKLGI